MKHAKRRLRHTVVLGAVLSVFAGVTFGSATAKPDEPGFLTAKPAMLAPVAPGVTVKPLLNVGDTVGGYKFESLPDGIAIDEQHRNQVDVYVNHETSLVPFGARGSDFTNALLSKLTLNEKNGGTLAGNFVIPNEAGYQRFCSNFLASREHGFKNDILFIGEEARDWVFRSTAGPATPFAPGAEQAGVMVAYDVETGAYRTIYGMGRHNHENGVALEGYRKPVILSGDDTFDAPASQLYLYTAKDGEAVWNDKGRLYAFVSDNLAVNDYGDIHSGESVSGHFIEVPRMIATGKKLNGDEVRASDFGFPAPPAGIPDGPQWVLETWSNISNAFQFIRIEDLAYDRKHENVVYFADTGEPRAIPNPATGRLMRGPNVSPPVGAYPNGRIYKIVLDKHDPLEVESLSILPNANFDLGGYNNVNVVHQPDNVETTKDSLLITEDPGGHNQGATTARVWRYNLDTETAPEVVLRVDQSSDPTTPKAALGAWESSGIVDASDAFGRDMFLVDVEAHGWELETATSPTRSRENGQLLLVKIPNT